MKRNVVSVLASTSVREASQLVVEKRVGTAANIVVVSLSRRTRTLITPALWNRKGLPVAIATLVVGSILFVLAYPWLSR